MAVMNYAANHEDVEQSFDIVPAGEYLAVIESSDYVSTKDGTGMILKLTYQIIDGNFKGRKIFENLNLENKSTQAVNIAKKALNGICKSVNILHLQDSAQLHNIPMKIDVKVKVDEIYGNKNEIKKHESAVTTTQAPVQPIGGPPTPAVGGIPTAPPTGQAKQPWEK